MRLMVFLHGTTIMHSGAAGMPREDRVRQVVEGHPSVRDFASYVPIGDAVKKLQGWAAQGAEILYLSSHRDPRDVEDDRAVLRRFGFPEGEVLYRMPGERYAEVVGRAVPDVLIEDDCESIGGNSEIIAPHLDRRARRRLRSHIVPEFGGIDHLPGALMDLAGVVVKLDPAGAPPSRPRRGC